MLNEIQEMEKYSILYLSSFNKYADPNYTKPIDSVFINKFRDAYLKLRHEEKTIIFNDFLSNNKKKDMQYYSKSTYYRRKKSAVHRFLKELKS
jgi:hypothetical protein